MTIYIIILAIIVVIAIKALFFINIKNKFNNFIIKIKEAEVNIDALLEKRKELLLQADKLIFELNNEEKITCLTNFENLDNFELNELLNKADNEFKDLIENKKAFIPSEDQTNLISNLELSNIDCKACELYYNDNVIIVNDLLEKIPYKLVGKICKYTKYDLYTWKEEEIFEILKN